MIRITEMLYTIFLVNGRTLSVRHRSRNKEQLSGVSINRELAKTTGIYFYFFHIFALALTVSDINKFQFFTLK